jgi:hypothetical protein
MHLTYHSSKSFLQAKNPQIAAEKRDMQYTCLSKWIIFLFFVYVEPVFIYSLNFIPLIALLSTFMKYRILSLDSDFHLTIYDKVFYHLQDYDVFSFIIGKSAKYFVKAIDVAINIVVEGILKRGGVDEENAALEECKKVLIAAVRRIELVFSNIYPTF